MNELSARLLENAWRDLDKKDRTVPGLKEQAERLYYFERDHRIDGWATSLEGLMTRPASHYHDYYDTEEGRLFFDWLERQGFCDHWEFPSFDGEDDEEVQHFIAYCIAVATWVAFEGAWEEMNYTKEEIAAFYEHQKAYGAPPAKRDERPNKPGRVKGRQLSMF